jgi:hypothetical protein
MAKPAPPSSMDDYSTFIASKAPQAPPSGLQDVPELPACLKPLVK